MVQIHSCAPAISFIGKLLPFANKWQCFCIWFIMLPDAYSWTSPKKGTVMNLFECKICSYIAFITQPQKCPVCGSQTFDQKDSIFEEAEKKSPEAPAKHIPVITVKTTCGLVPETPCMDATVRIGKVLHPMEEKHFISFMDCYVDKRYIARVMLSPRVNPAACFHLKTQGVTLTIVENCTVHGHWMAETDLKIAL